MPVFIYDSISDEQTDFNPKAFSILALAASLSFIQGLIATDQPYSPCDVVLSSIKGLFASYTDPSVQERLESAASELSAKAIAVNDRMNNDKTSLFLQQSSPDIARRQPSKTASAVVFMYEVVDSLIDAITVVTDEHSEVQGVFSHLAVVEFKYDDIVWRYEALNLGLGSDGGDGIKRVIGGNENPLLIGDAFMIDTLFSVLVVDIASKLARDFFTSLAEQDEATVNKAKALANIAGDNWRSYIPIAYDYQQLCMAIATNNTLFSAHERDVIVMKELTTLSSDDIDKALKGFAAV